MTRRFDYDPSERKDETVSGSSYSPPSEICRDEGLRIYDGSERKKLKVALSRLTVRVNKLWEKKDSFTE